ncbi:hypothetical protein [Alkalimarinus alittae]|uniref:Glycosyltransferase 2-like domain-containing protein n=1 Tax=Alkalimarinus alittae TaxID=2961619 RepID=A0ABY6MYF6_9ALTE|nr:hypothetical protein [Alkalimarinus alittae]UZE94853.1 hypothetical protein NKI27_12270 [Alkalimarinus alittae]
MGSGKQQNALNKYLIGYSEPEVSRLNTISTQYAHTLVIPLYDEPFEIVNLLLNTEFHLTPSTNDQGVLFILVVNCPENGEQAAVDRTTHLLQQLTASVEPIFTRENLIFAKAGKTSTEKSSVERNNGVIIVDRCTEGRRIPKKQGVGLARKIGADIACQLISTETIKSPWIHSTDADVILPVNYFSCVQQVRKYDQAANTSGAMGENKGLPVALIYPFKHVPEKGYETASELYDWSLRYYVESIRCAGSRYAYHTIGSLIAVDFEAYAKVRGFPKRSGGEDFYLLNKLAKIGQITNLQTPVINIAARPSQRVPFGTGPAICKITENKQAIETHVFYHPCIFQQLNMVYTVIQQSWKVRDNQTVGCSAEILAALEGAYADFKIISKDITRQAVDALNTLGFVAAFKHATIQSGTEQQFIKQMTVWFDAFKTLKFVHYMRDHGYPSLTLKNVLKETCILSDELKERAEKLLSMTAD